jgi:hypothetical protein
MEYGCENSSVIVDKESIRWVDRKFGSGSDDSYTLSGEDNLEIDHLFNEEELKAIAEKNRSVQ